ncbi:winged helix-turn-helix domain-containing protein [Aliiglaciecola sp. LCG003]|uniref:nSTAND1 domain-containing NTPase n=1 Tax=Aliiglaciecola sp. LCG003 TaxID=3053655 RepID=UPI0025732174|nr:winged helix-turn-helix domain-containing protein [Aliiglaciecola sp. LCG003]WJG10111.1 winged helix-turn-helix domain-containing protein [Aliiglaciecola sp. LCG003]
MDINQFFLGDWQVSPASNSLRLGKTVNVVEPKAMDVLLLLCQNSGQVLSADQIVNQCWGSSEMGDNPIHKAINQLRKALGDSAANSIYIETIRKRGYRVIAEVVFPHDDQSRAEKSSWQGSSPFMGLNAYEPGDSAIFFGRQVQINHLLTRLTEQLARNRTFSLILGPSGSGKSSLVNAGVLPRLFSDKGVNGIGVLSYASIDFANINKGRLWIDIASSLLDWDVGDVPVFDGMSADNIAQTLQSDPQSIATQCLNAIENSVLANRYVYPRLFLFIDRLEVLISSPLFEPGERQSLLNAIEHLAVSGAVIVFSACRNDFYPLVVTYPALMAGKEQGAHFDLTAPSTAELSQMIRLPAIAANLQWSKDPQSGMQLDELLVIEAANHPDSLPLLQYTLQELYLQRSGDEELLVEVYQDLGGIEGAIGKKAEEVFASFQQDNQAELEYVLSLLVTLSQDGENLTSRAARWSQLENEQQTNFVQAMVDHRLFVSHLRNAEPCFSVAHEALLRRWSRVKDWIGKHKESLAVKSRLTEQAQRWLAENNSPAYLLSDGKPLQEALLLKQSSELMLQADELALIDASQSVVKHKRWFKRSVVLLLCILTLVSIFMSFRSQQAEQLAQQKRAEAESLLGFMVGEFADKLRSVKRMDLLDGISNKAIEYFSLDEPIEGKGFQALLGSQTTNLNSHFQHAQTLHAMAEVAYSRHKYDEAKQGFQAAKQRLEQLLLQKPEDLELLKMLGANAFWLGQIDYDDDKFISAQTSFQQYLTYSQQMVELAPGDLDSLQELSFAHNSLGSLAISQRQYNEAKQAFSLSLELKTKVLGQNPDDLTLIADKAEALSWLAKTSEHLGKLNEALEYYYQGQRELERALQSSENDAYAIESLIYIHSHQTKILQYLGKNTLAYEHNLSSLGLVNNLLQQDPENKFWQQDKLLVQLSQLLLAEKMQSEGELNSTVDTAALAAYIESQVTELPTLRLDLAEFYQSRQHWQKSENILQGIKLQLANGPAGAQNPQVLPKLEMLFARQRWAAQDLSTMHQHCMAAIKQLQPIVDKSLEAQFNLLYLQAHQCRQEEFKISKLIQNLQNMNLYIPANFFP